jgi:hypothetical protein
MHESMALQKTKKLEITPLGAPMKKLGRPLSQAAAPAQVARDRGAAAPPSLDSEAVRALVIDPARVREVILLNEILLPPVALRRRRR